ncbi:hypothetical protein DID78_03770 [Candidatus Marinamargulisbacteria bacterium SCGC AG-343-D04]|nr:hypothetical protein DID78_03770 [Candidatus Marinamargulisbacteria bacterium SCGC AG-343-D04]
MRQLLKGMIILLLCSSCIFAASDKYLVEDNLTKVAQKTLDAMFGENNFIVRIQVAMTDSKYSVKYTQESNPKRSKSKSSQKEVYILPGVPALKNIAPGSLNQLPYDSVTSMTAPRITKMLIYVLANKSYPRSKAKRAEKVLREILGAKQGRDVVKFEYKAFYEDPNKETQNITIVPGVEPLLTPENVFYLIFALLLLGLIVAYVMYQNKLLAKETGGGQGGPAINVNPNLELPENMGGGGAPGAMSVGGAPSIKYYFDFVTAENISDFSYLVNSQNLKAEYICLIASFLQAPLAAKLLKGVDVKVQTQVAMSLVDQRLGSKVILDKLEKKLKADLECFIGGESKVSNVLRQLSSTEKKNIVELAKKSNAAGYRKIRPHLILFEDLSLLEERELQVVLSEVNLEQLAVSLINVSQDLFDVVVENLTKAAKDMVNQYLELKTDVTHAADIEKAQDAIIALIKKMDTSGKINIMDKLRKA